MDQLARAYLDQIAQLDPTAATFWGVLGHDRELTDHGPAAEGGRAALAEGTLAELERATADSRANRLAGTAMRERLRSQVALHQAGQWMRPLHLFGPLNAIRRVFDLMPRSQQEHWEQLSERMGKVPEAIASVRSTLEEGLSRGVTSARRQVEVAATQARTYGGANHAEGYFRHLARTYQEEDGGLGSRLSQQAEAADQAYLAMAQFLTEGYLPHAQTRDGVGAETYQLFCHEFNGITIDAAATYQWGWEELDRIEAEMEATAEQILPGASLAQVIELLDTDPSRAVEGEDNFQRWNQEFLDRTMAELDGRHFDIAGPVRRVEAMLAPPGAGPAMYYTPPTSDFTRPGRTWYPTMGRTTFPLWTEVATAYHEGVPGHHLQVGHTYWLGERLNPFQGKLGHVSGHVEGWALYAERLMGELGYLDNPDYRLGMLANQAFRAARVVVDLGLHLELELDRSQPFHPGEPWTFELAVEFMRQKSGRSFEFCKGEVERYLGMPSQAI
ncbi:MAG: DUF885 domain-containing protein, partial [Candidatus Dormibacteria bacterium]